MGPDKQGLVGTGSDKSFDQNKATKKFMSPSKNTTSLGLVEKHTILIRNQWIWHFWSVSGGILVVRKEDSVENNFKKRMLNVKYVTFQPATSTQLLQSVWRNLCRNF